MRQMACSRRIHAGKASARRRPAKNNARNRWCGHWLFLDCLEVTALQRRFPEAACYGWTSSPSTFCHPLGNRWPREARAPT